MIFRFFLMWWIFMFLVPISFQEWPINYNNSYCRVWDSLVSSDPYLIYLFGNFPMSYDELENLFLQRYNVKNISRGGVISKGSEKNECPLMHSLIELNEDFHDTDNFENFWSSFQYLKNFSQHLFISTNNTHFASDVCSKKNTKNPKILSIFHEYNMPYEVPCINCAHGTNDNDTVYGSTYHMYMSGRIGQSEIYCMGGDKHNCTSTHESITIPSRILREVLGFSFGSPYYRQFTYKYEGYSSNYLSHWSTDTWERHGAVFYAERSNSIENGFMDELVPEISNTTGSLLVNPGIELHRWHDTLMDDLYYGRLSTVDEQKACIDMRNLFWKYFYWNAGSFYCKKANNENYDDFTTEPDVIVNVDSLIHPYETHVPDQSKFNLYDISSNKLLHDDRGNWHLHMFDQKKRFLIGDYEPFLDENDAHKQLNNSMNKSEWNLRLGIYWKSWSCCSRCCCSEETCGRNFDWQDECYSIPSYRTRLGFLSWFKIDPDKNLNFPEGSMNSFPIAYSEFNYLLSTFPYRIEGIPVFSTMFNAPVDSNQKHYFPEWKILEEWLWENFGKKYRAVNPKDYTSNSNVEYYPAGGLGMFVDMAECSLEEKMDCNELIKCRQKELSAIIPIAEKDRPEWSEPVSSTPVSPTPKKNCRHEVSYIDLKMDYQEKNDSKRVFFFVIKQGGNYSLSAYNYSKYMNETSWHLGTDQTHIEMQNENLDCTDHQIFTLKENGSLYIMNLKASDIKRPYIVQTRNSFKLKAILHFESEEAFMREYQETLRIYWYTGIGIISGSLLIGFLGICCLSYRRNKFETASQVMEEKLERAAQRKQDIKVEEHERQAVEREEQTTEDEDHATEAEDQETKDEEQISEDEYTEDT